MYIDLMVFLCNALDIVTIVLLGGLYEVVGAGPADYYNFEWQSLALGRLEHGAGPLNRTTSGEGSHPHKVEAIR